MTPPGGAVGTQERRVALVVGNSLYQTFAPLENPANDAQDMAAQLERLGFEVNMQLDVDRNQLDRAITEFGLRIREGGVGLFYYSGHAVQVGGKNYMVPVDAEIDIEDYVSVESVDLDEVLQRMGGARNRVNIVILDACRNNPFEGQFRSVSRGLAAPNAPSGTFIAFSAAPNQVARDGRGERNSPYTAALLSRISQPGMPIENVFKGVGIEVMTKTERQQTPWVSSSLTGDFYFAPEQAAASAASDSGTAPLNSSVMDSPDLVVWTAIASSPDPLDFMLFLQKYPNSPLVPFAQRRLDELGGPPPSQQQQVADARAVTPSGTPRSQAAPPAAQGAALGAAVGAGRGSAGGNEELEVAALTDPAQPAWQAAPQPAPTGSAWVGKDWVLVAPPDNAAIVAMMSHHDKLPGAGDQLSPKVLAELEPNQQGLVRNLFDQIKGMPAAESRGQELVRAGVLHQHPLDQWRRVRPFPSEDKCEVTLEQLRTNTQEMARKLAMTSSMWMDDLRWHVMQRSYQYARCVFEPS